VGEGANGGLDFYFGEMIEVFATSRTVVITVAPIIGFPPVQGIGVRFAGIGIDWQPNGELAALFDSVSVSVGASVAHCYAVSFELFPRKSEFSSRLNSSPASIMGMAWHLGSGAR
jgi:hypothetical protein